LPAFMSELKLRPPKREKQVPRAKALGMTNF
jgi:hypothetical protein